MNFNFNDPAGVQALLDQIRTSPEWQQLSEASAARPPPGPASTLENSIPKDRDAYPENNSSTPSVASLLSQLKSAPETLTAPPPKQNATPQNARPQDEAHSPTITTAPVQTDQPPPKDLRWLDFDNSMPYLLQLSREPAFVEEMKKIKQDQDALERRLWGERRSIHKKYEDKLRAANTKASIIGGNISKHEAEMFVDAHKTELRKFDEDRALPAWDSLVTQQQLKLQRLQVPTMHVTSDPSVRELQQRVLQVLTSILGPSIK